MWEATEEYTLSFLYYGFPVRGIKAVGFAVDCPVISPACRSQPLTIQNRRRITYIRVPPHYSDAMVARTEHITILILYLVDHHVDNLDTIYLLLYGVVQDLCIPEQDLCI